jgi:hypothetical protein
MADFFGGHETNTAVSPGQEGRTAPPSFVVTQSSIKDFPLFDESAGWPVCAAAVEKNCCLKLHERLVCSAENTLLRYNPTVF